MKKPTVILAPCPSYDPSLIFQTLQQYLPSLLPESLSGKIILKPNVVLAHPKVAPSCYTRPEVVEGVVNVLMPRLHPPFSFHLMENSGTGVPTAKMLKRAGYYALKKSIPSLSIEPYEESLLQEVTLSKAKVHPTLRIHQSLARKDFLIHLPKLKTNVLTNGMTASMKLNMGIIGDRVRMKGHNQHLPEKIIDFLEVAYPDLIVTDAIEIAMGGNQMTEHGVFLGLLILADDPLAHDVVCAHLLGLNPHEMPLFEEAQKRGYTVPSLEDIHLIAEEPLERFQERVKDKPTGFIRVEEAPSPFPLYIGEPYCVGGCQGVLLDWLYMIKDRAPERLGKKKNVALVVGEYEGEVREKRVILLGDCTKLCTNGKKKRVSRISGCPIRHKDLILHLFLKTGVASPLFRLDLIWDSYPVRWWSFIKGFVKRSLFR